MLVAAGPWSSTPTAPETRAGPVDPWIGVWGSWRRMRRCAGRQIECGANGSLGRAIIGGRNSHEGVGPLADGSRAAHERGEGHGAAIRASGHVHSLDRGRRAHVPDRIEHRCTRIHVGLDRMRGARAFNFLPCIWILDSSVDSHIRTHIPQEQSAATAASTLRYCSLLLPRQAATTAADSTRRIWTATERIGGEHPYSVARRCALDVLITSGRT